MPHISTKKIDEKMLKKIYETLFSAIISKNVTQKQQRLAFKEFFTYTEKIMLGKRLLAIALLSEGKSSYEVARLLKLSTTTTMKFRTRMENEKMEHVKTLCTILKKGPLQHYVENLLKPMPRYGTSPATLFKEQ